MNPANSSSPTTAARPLDHLVRQAREGDVQAFGEIYTCFHSELVRYLIHRTGDVDVAEDLAQQSFIKAWQHLPRYEHRGYFKAWLYRIATNHLVDHYRRRRTFVDIASVDVEEPSEAESSVIDGELHRYLRRALDRLPNHYREVLILRFMLNLPAAEVGERMNRSADAVRAMQVRAICALREQFEAWDVLR